MRYPLFKRWSSGLFCVIIILVHVHLFAYTVENPFNPLFFIRLLSVSPPYLSIELENVFSLLIPSIVTIGAAYILLKWRRWGLWGMSILICIIIRYFVCYKLIYLMPNFKHRIVDIYFSIYHYFAFERIIIEFSIHICLLIIYYVLYSIVKSRESARSEGQV